MIRWLFALFLISSSVLGAVYELPSDRRIDWTKTGLTNGFPSDYYSGGTVTITNSPYNAVPDGVTDTWGAIDNAITNASLYEIIYFPPGTYSISADILIGPGHASRYDKKIILRGSDPSTTKILLNYNGGQGGIYVRGTAASTRYYLFDGYTFGSTNVNTVATPSGIAVGDFVGIGQTYDTTFFVGDLEVGEYDYQYAQVVAITNGTNFTLDLPLMRTFTAGQSPWIEKVGLHTGVGIENIRIETASGKTPSRGMFFWRTAFCWGSSIVVTNYDSMGITLQDCYRDEFAQADVFYTGSRTSSSYGFQFANRSTRNRLYDSIYKGQPTAIMFQHGAWGNVIGHNYIIRLLATGSGGWGIGGHGSGAYMNLIEGNVTDEVRLDQVWGANPYNVIFRNFCTRIEPILGPRDMNDNAYGLRVDATNYYASAINNIVWEATYKTNSAEYYGNSPDACCGYDTAVTNTMINHGNFYAWANVTNYTDAATEFTNSYAWSSRPRWFGNVDWPIIGSDVQTSMISSNPAVLRSLGIDYLSVSGTSDRLKLRGIRLRP